MKLHSIVVPIVVVWSFTVSALAANLPLVVDGQPKAVIVLSSARQPSDFSAKLLIDHVRQMSGATLPTIKESELGDARIENGRLVSPEGKTSAETFILLGESELTRRLGLSLDELGPGGILVQTGGNTLALLAKFDGLDNGRYPVHARAVVRLLETLGCRCLWPGPSGKVIPERRTITVSDMNVRFTPPIGQRNIRFTPLDARGAAQGLAWLGITAAEQRAAYDAAVQTEPLENWAV